MCWMWVCSREVTTREDRVTIDPSTNREGHLPDFSKVSFLNEAYLDRTPNASVKLSSTGRTI